MLHSSVECLDRIGEIEKKIESFTKVIQGPKEDFTKLLQRLTFAVNRMIPNSKVSQIITESLAFENDNSPCKRIIRPIKGKVITFGEMYLR